MKFKWTLYIKIQLLIVVLLLMIYIAVMFTLYGYIGIDMSSRFQNNIEETTQLLHYNIEQVFLTTNQMIDYLVDDISEHNFEDERIKDHLESVMVSHPQYLNAFAGFEDKTIYIHPYTDLGPDFDTRTRPWYKIAYGHSGVKWSKPYFDRATGNQVITASKYVELLDQKGVVGVDISLSQLTNMLKELEVSENGVIALLNNANQVVATNKSEILGTSFGNILKEDKHVLTYSSGQVETASGKYFIRIFNQSSLRLLVFIPIDDYEGVRRKALGFMTVIITVTLVLGIVVSRWIILRLIKPIVMLRDTIVESSKSDGMVLYKGETNDEINTLIIEYNTLANHVNVQGEEIKRLAYTDDLTGLPNRIQFDQIARAALESCDKLALFYLDLDNFKYINDTYGHAAGDQVLVELANALSSCCVNKHTISRLSGDEFGVLIENYEREEEIEALASRMLELVRRPLYINQLDFTLTASLGVSRYPADAKTYEELLANADIAMYDAKNSSKDDYAIFDNKIRDEFVREMNIETKLVQAIEEKKIYALYQPLMDLKNGRIVGFEALARWKDDELGFVYPDVFIPIAERTLSINNLGMQILEQAVAFGKALFLRYNRYYEVNVNISVIQLHVDRFVEDVLIVLAKYGYPAKYLNLEITESLTLESDDQVMMKLAYLRKKEIQISIDDFGTGYSSLSHLTDLSVTHIKIDRQLILKARQSSEVLKLMKGIVDFAHTLNYKVVAEGIEDEEMEGMIIEMEADFGQGYMYAKPCTEDKIIEIIDKEEDKL